MTDTPTSDEPVLPDDYPIYHSYWYLFDGEPMRSAFGGITVKKLKHRSGAKEIRRCDAVKRKLPLW